MSACISANSLLYLFVGLLLLYGIRRFMRTCGFAARDEHGMIGLKKEKAAV